MRPLVLATLAAGMIVAACAPKSGSVSSPAPAATAPPAAAPSNTPAPSTPPPSTPPATQPAAAPAPTTPAPAASATPPVDEFSGGGRGRGGRGGPPPPPPTPPPAVMPAPVKPIVSATAPTPDPRVGLAPGRWDAAQAAWNIRLVSTTPPWETFLGVTSSDLAFTGKYVVQGNYNGFEVFDISNPVKPKIVLTYLCPASQSDVSVYKNLLFVSGEGQTGRVDCGIQGVPEPVSKDRLRGIRIFDISNMSSPKYVANVQTCRGSHTHTVVTQPGDKDNVYIYVSGSAGVRSADELPGCKDGPVDDPDSARFRLEVIKVPLAAPDKAAIVSSPRIFYGLAPPPRRVEPGRGGAGRGNDAAAPGAPGAPRQALRAQRVNQPPLPEGVVPAGPTRVRISAMTSPSTPRSALPAVRVAGMDCCSTSRMSSIRSGSIRPPTSTCRSGTPRPSATTAPKSCSPTSGVVGRSHAAARPTSSNGARTRFSRSRTARCSSRATTRCRRRRRRSKIASRTTDR